MGNVIIPASFLRANDGQHVAPESALPVIPRFPSHQNHVAVSYKSVWAIPRQKYFLVCDPDSNDVYQKMKSEALLVNLALGPMSRRVLPHAVVDFRKQGIRQ